MIYIYIYYALLVACFVHLHRCMPKQKLICRCYDLQGIEYISFLNYDQIKYHSLSMGPWLLIFFLSESVCQPPNPNSICRSSQLITTWIILDLIMVRMQTDPISERLPIHNARHAVARSCQLRKMRRSKTTKLPTEPPESAPN